MTLELYQLDAFADAPFTGNPAAVVPLESWLADDVMQAIALENNLSETAFIMPAGDAARWGLRWFTPAMEVPLCGHATFAAGACIMRHLKPELDEISFDTQSGELSVRRHGAGFVMDLPAGKPKAWSMPDAARTALGVTIEDSAISTYPFVVLPDEQAVRNLDVHKAVAAARLAHACGELVVCAPGDGDVDVILRFFAPGAGVDEDPVTGSAITYIAPYWQKQLGKSAMRFYQASPRGGHVGVKVRGGRVLLSGQARDYLHGVIALQI